MLILRISTAVVGLSLLSACAASSSGPAAIQTPAPVVTSPTIATEPSTPETATTTGTLVTSSAEPVTTGGGESTPTFSTITAPSLIAPSITKTFTPPPSPSPFEFPAGYSTATKAQTAAISPVYDNYLADTAGLDGDFDSGWVTRLREVAARKLVHASLEVAEGLQKLHDHTVGALRDSHQEIKVKGDSAVIIDCLDEVDWYIVDDSTGKADPGETPGNYEGFAALVDKNGTWRVTVWKPGQITCTF